LKDCSRIRVTAFSYISIGSAGRPLFISQEAKRIMPAARRRNDDGFTVTDVSVMLLGAITQDYITRRI
jgi:hypothetical protein